MDKKWLIPPGLNAEEEEAIQSLCAELKAPELIAKLLYRKGLREIKDIEEFFNPNLEHLADPFLFEDMEIAVNRILKAVENNELITIYGDYDVDGTTATSLLYLGLKRIGANIDFYIPHRMIDGYGLSLGSLDQLAENGSKLIVSVDCGVNAIEEIRAITQMGMEIIITDHHNPKAELPPALAIINPKIPGCKYPFPHLAGVGVAYKLLIAIYHKMGIDSTENILKYMDLVAVGTIADIVPLIGENRIFAHIGLQHLIEMKNLGLNALIQLCGLNQRTLDTTDIVFGIAPRINAAGRMGSAALAVELLISTDENQSFELAEMIERDNSLRQQEDQKTFHEACDIIEKKYKNIANTPCMIVSSDDWHQGVIGIVASKLVEKYYRPVIMISFKDGFGSGSGRSVADFDLFSALQYTEHNLHSFGGHKYAVGLTIYQEYLDRFENELSRYVADHLKLEQIQPPLSIDHEIELYDVNDNLLDSIERFAPFGPENLRPTFMTREVTVANYPYNVGRNHLKLKVVKDGISLELIGYNMGDYLNLLKKNSIVNIAYTLEYNRFGNKSSIQGKLKDMQILGA
ncbi:MAG: single-stranded-DNA-specific exonuclease RecJ [Candidatus Cloacimonetes bacterium]|jgi:single-stranded-DNA-specific exonuclease|nr:single-stranded-DNA-specific exonuclease RecJ [Candidatus Cloacimonadota bacterium]MDY0298404.1 single-stranded-DNA-specific exonuclease RecJ [Candidatus Cloacimonadaceae bacterium]MCB5278199.1 single-stranded-DNA-specific exonuclease RecJ [Candidatus Cloacimonadota bacterium]MCK9331764.1 single-stranded-DNA-specific exonuclease RecJ [Candidatus Cloacimonadota bacterium]MDD2209856.1 single-stranded-DNA-specific exonuclease RecJ [Candidatus Cloacimonadota bacterium]